MNRIEEDIDNVSCNGLSASTVFAVPLATYSTEIRRSFSDTITTGGLTN